MRCGPCGRQVRPSLPCSHAPATWNARPLAPKADPPAGPRPVFRALQAERGRKGAEVTNAKRSGALRERRERVALLRAAGWSVRDIALVTGVSRWTVNRDVVHPANTR